MKKYINLEDLKDFEVWKAWKNGRLELETEAHKMNTPEKLPKEKAQELLRRFFVVSDGALDDPEGPALDPENYAIARNCAIACIDFIYQFMKEDDELHDSAHFANSVWVDYYQRVIKEL